MKGSNSNHALNAQWKLVITFSTNWMLLVFAKWAMGGASFSPGALHVEATFLL